MGGKYQGCICSAAFEVGGGREKKKKRNKQTKMLNLSVRGNNVSDSLPVW